MPTTLTKTSTRLILPLLLGCILLAGCGGSSSSKSSSSSGGSNSGGTSTSANNNGVTGPKDFQANLLALMSKSHPQLIDVKTNCPHAAPSQLPYNCRFTAIDKGEKIPKSKPGQKQKQQKANPALIQKLTHRHPVAGTISIYGVYQRTHTYIYGLQFGPTS